VRELQPGEIPRSFVVRFPTGRAWLFGPEDQVFNLPVTISLALDELPSSVPALATVDLDGSIDYASSVEFEETRPSQSPRGLSLAASGRVRGLISHFSPFVPVGVEFFIDDGFIDSAGAFQASKETFVVGEGGDDLVFSVTASNRTTSPFTGVQMTVSVGPTGVLDLEEIGFVSQGAVGGKNSRGFQWFIGTLAPGLVAVIQFSAAAVGPGNGFNQVTLSSDQASGLEVPDAEPTLVIVGSAPVMPSALTATVNAQAREVVLTWNDNSLNEMGFRIELSCDGDPFMGLNELPSNTTEATVFGFQGGEVCSLRVIAFNTSGVSPASNTVTVTIP
jgi:hypothetical protein